MNKRDGIYKNPVSKTNPNRTILRKHLLIFMTRSILIVRSKVKYPILIILLILFTFCKEQASNKKTENNTEYLLVSAKPYINIRKQPNQNSEKIGKIEYGKIVSVIEKSTISETIDSKTGFWVKVNHNGTTGWVFDAFLAKSINYFDLFKAIVKTVPSPNKDYTLVIKSKEEGNEKCDENFNVHSCIFAVFKGAKQVSEPIDEIYPNVWETNTSILASSNYNDGDYQEIEFFRLRAENNFKKESLLAYTTFLHSNEPTHIAPQHYIDGFDKLEIVCKDEDCIYFLTPIDSKMILIEKIVSDKRIKIHEIEDKINYNLIADPDRILFKDSSKLYTIRFHDNAPIELLK
ncbi:SH3 domain-containing protein [Leptospira idonii]|uniref:SH3 domain-containing protein n=1 Tax=Leptospira idonii TaxID=1193500 RepID=A0A4V3JYB3_9LEPT|nr:SH3 domain-containing protein [Leptospira idonii]